MKKILLCLILILSLSISFVFADSTTYSAIRLMSSGGLRSTAVASDAINPNAFPYWSTSQRFNVSRNSDYVFSVSPSIRYLVGICPSPSDPNRYAAYIFSTSDLLTSSVTFTSEGNVTVYFSDLFSYRSLNYRSFWFSNSVSINPSIPYYDSLNSMASAFYNYVNQSYDLDEYIWKVPKLSDLSFSTLSSSPARLRTSAPYFYYGSTSNYFYRAISRFVKTSDIGGNQGEVFYSMYFYSQYDPTEIIGDTIGITSSSDQVVSYPGTSFVYDDSLQLWSFSTVVTNTASGGAVDVPCFNDTFSMKQAVADYFNTTFSESSSLTLPASNMFVLDLGASGVSYDIDLSAVMPAYSSVIGSPFLPTAFYFFSNVVPTVGNSFTRQNHLPVEWEKSSGDRNWLGQTKSAVANLSGTSQGRYLYIINELYYDFDHGVYNTNLVINKMPANARVYSFPLSCEFGSTYFTYTITGAGGTGVNSSDGGNIQLVSTQNSEIYYNSPFGGSNDVPEYESIQAANESLNHSLSDFFNNVLEFLGKPVVYIQNLINAGSAFFSHLSGLWSWLPSEVSSLITSALVIMVSVAVFKVFL